MSDHDDDKTRPFDLLAAETRVTRREETENARTDSLREMREEAAEGLYAEIRRFCEEYSIPKEVTKVVPEDIDIVSPGGGLLKVRPLDDGEFLLLLYDPRSQAKPVRQADHQETIGKEEMLEKVVVFLRRYQ